MTAVRMIFAMTSATSKNVDHELLNIFLRRSDRHLAAMALYFFATEGQLLETSIWKIPFLDPVTKTILEHAILSAVDISRRDALSLIDATSFSPLEVEPVASLIKSGVKMCRMHWCGQHWTTVLREFKRYTGIDLVSRLQRMQTADIFPDLMTAIASREI
jgi:hypothetical protein